MYPYSNMYMYETYQTKISFVSFEVPSTRGDRSKRGRKGPIVRLDMTRIRNGNIQKEEPVPALMSRYT